MLRIKEGNEYKFFIEKELTLPDASRHYVCKGPDSNKYLIPVSRYGHYGISTGSYIKCRVDRINCKGQVFLEPRNPWYSEGKTYSFEVAGTEARTDRTGTIRETLIVIDKTGNRIAVGSFTSPPFPKPGKKIKLIVERISKSKVLLTDFNVSGRDQLLREGHNYQFVIEGIEKGMDDEEYFIVKDDYGNRHTIVREYYEYYGYSVGTRFKGKMIKFRKNGETAIEPENPFYKPGSVVKMEVTAIESNLINQTFTISLKDKFGFSHCIESASPLESKTIKCRIVMIKKGRPLLELL